MNLSTSSTALGVSTIWIPVVCSPTLLMRLLLDLPIVKETREYVLSQVRSLVPPGQRGGPPPPPARAASSSATTVSATAMRSGPTRGLLRVRCTRLVSSTITSRGVGSIQIDVPVKPVCPKLVESIRAPALLFGEGVSQPSAREEPGTRFWRRVNSRRTDGRTEGRKVDGPPPPTGNLPSFRPSVSLNIHSPNVSKSSALPNSPAWPATPPSHAAFSSCTSPRTIRFRQAVSYSVGAIRATHSGGGREMVA